MRFMLTLLLIASFSFISGIFFPWWTIAPVSFLVTLFIRQNPFSAFTAGFLGIFLLWAILATWTDIKNNSILSHKIALIFPLGGSSVLLIIVTAFAGGLVGAFASMAASYCYSKTKI